MVLSAIILPSNHRFGHSVPGGVLRILRLDRLLLHVPTARVVPFCHVPWFLFTDFICSTKCRSSRGCRYERTKRCIFGPGHVRTVPAVLRLLRFVRRHSHLLRWITYLSYIRYGFEGTALATYSYGREKLKCHQVYCHFKSPATTLEELDMLDANFTLDIVALVVIFAVLRVAAFLFLRWKLKTTR